MKNIFVALLALLPLSNLPAQETREDIDRINNKLERILNHYKRDLRKLDHLILDDYEDAADELDKVILITEAEIDRRDEIFDKLDASREIEGVTKYLFSELRIEELDLDEFMKDVERAGVNDVKYRIVKKANRTLGVAKKYREENKKISSIDSYNLKLAEEFSKYSIAISNGLNMVDAGAYKAVYIKALSEYQKAQMKFIVEFANKNQYANSMLSNFQRVLFGMSEGISIDELVDARNELDKAKDEYDKGKLEEKAKGHYSL
jgi:hypothetical protein